MTTIIFDVTVATEMDRSVSLPLGEIVLWQAANELLVRKEERKRERERERESEALKTVDLMLNFC